MCRLHHQRFENLSTEEKESWLGIAEELWSDYVASLDAIIK
jgi:hypothetical protein